MIWFTLLTFHSHSCVEDGCEVEALWGQLETFHNPPASSGDVGDAGSIPGSGRSPGEEHGSPLQSSCLENPMDRGAWWDTVCRVGKSWTLKWLSKHGCLGETVNRYELYLKPRNSRAYWWIGLEERERLRGVFLCTFGSSNPPRRS